MCPLAGMPTIPAIARPRSTDVTRGFKVDAKPNDKGSGRIRPFAATDFLDTLPGCAPEALDLAPQPASTMLVLPIAGAERGRSEPAPASPPVSTSLLAAGATRRPGRIKEDPPNGGAVEVSPGFAARRPVHPAVAPTPHGRTGGPADAYRARAARRPGPEAPTRKTGRLLGLVLLCCAALASAVVIQLRLGRAMHAARIAAIAEAPAAIPRPVTQSLDERAAPGREPVAIPASLSVEHGASASKAAEPTAMPAAPTESPTVAPAPTDRKRVRPIQSPRAASQPVDVAAAIQAAQARADAFLRGPPASSVEPNSTR